MYSFKKNRGVFIVVCLAIISSSFQKRDAGTEDSLATVKLVFINNVSGSKIVFRDSTYTNSFGEKYTLTKLRYYITNIFLQSRDRPARENESYHLIDESKAESQVINFEVAEGDYNSLQFLLGVDSLHNVSGAQSGDLDPANDMFWTWRSGYVMAKMEGNSLSSTQVNNKFEFHIGGFSGEYNVLQQVALEFPAKTFHFIAGKTYEIKIDADINTWWQHPHDIKISDHAVITTPGELAKEISENYANMFHIEKIISE